jgi:predicted RNase H-like HicB family nuclease
MSNSRRKSAVPKAPSGALANIELLIDGNGDITIGAVGRIPCVATAADEDQCLAMLQRRHGESLAELLQRLDAAIEDAYENGVYIDEVNTPPRSKPSGRSRA